VDNPRQSLRVAHVGHCRLGRCPIDGGRRLHVERYDVVGPVLAAERLHQFAANLAVRSGHQYAFHRQ
jgi:hypothetical protein